MNSWGTTNLYFEKEKKSMFVFIENMIDAIADWIERCVDWVKGLFTKKPDSTVYVADYLTRDDVIEPVDIPVEPLRWKIWLTHYDIEGNMVGRGVHPVDYAQKCSAVRRAKQLWGVNPLCCKWEVSQTNPWAICEEEAYDEGGYGYVKCE
jgi:hypothetical protein